MTAMPFQIIFVWLRGLLSILLLLLGLYLLWEWYEQSRVFVTQATTQATAATSAPTHEKFHFEPGWNRQTALLAGAVVTLLYTFAGGLVLTRLFSRRGKDDPVHTRGGTAYSLHRDGSVIHVEAYGQETGPLVVLTHGLGTDSEEWYYAKRELGEACHVVVWDTPGLGRSKGSADNDYSLARLAGDLMAVVRDVSERAGGKPVVLVGHSMGGMIQLELCRVYPEELGRSVAGVVQVHTTYTNPIKTAKHGGMYQALQKPVIEPLLHLTIGLSPLVRVMNVMSYLNGSTHRSQKRSGFGGTQTYGQVDFIARYSLTSPPSVNARVMLQMLGWDAASTLRTIPVPTLVITGDRDPTCLPEASGRMQADIPNASLKELAPGKHYAMIEHHAEFARSVTEFVHRVA